MDASIPTLNTNPFLPPPLTFRFPSLFFAFRKPNKSILPLIFQISRTAHLNPITQDTLSSHPRFITSCFPYKGYLWNYGAFPQTWEDPHHTSPTTSHRGDNDPLDVCLLSRAVLPTGTVRQVRPLGILALIDSDETDWKVLAVDISDQDLSSALHDIDDVEEVFPGLLDATRDWFRIYKIPDGAEANRYALHGKFQDKKYAEKVIRECNAAWKRLIKGEVKGSGDISLSVCDQRTLTSRKNC